MTESSGFAAIITRDGGRREIAEREIVPAVRRGEVLVLRGALHRLGIHHEIAETTLAVIRDVCGPEQADACRRLGFERLHEALDGAELERAVHATHARLSVRYAPFVKAIVHDAVGWRRPFYVHRSLLVRFLTPYDFEARHAERFTQRANLGRLSGHAPHQDYWFGTPLNSINVWMAISAVERDNGLSIFPDAWGAALGQDGRYVLKGQYLGVPMGFACEAGDLVLFHSRHVHASALNVSAATRFVVTGRFCVEPPVAPKLADLEATCLYSPLVGTRFEPYAQTATKFALSHVVERLKQRAANAVTAVERRVGGAPLRFAGRAARRLFRYRRGDLALHVPPALRRSIAAPASPDEIEEGQIAPLDARTCVARVDGQLYAFERRCPHQGADLALGYISDGQVHCAWHNYRFDPSTGRGPCAAIPAVRTSLLAQAGALSPGSPLARAGSAGEG